MEESIIVVYEFQCLHKADDYCCRKRNGRRRTSIDHSYSFEATYWAFNYCTSFTQY